MTRTFNPDEVTFKLATESEDIPVRGHYEDAELEDAILDDLESGNEWAWAYVKVSASWAGFTGSDGLGGCSYKSEADFRENSGYLPLRLEGAVDDLLRQIEEAGWDVTCTEDAVKTAIARETGKENAA